ncbi:unnamed protein product [Rotaria magnacalcarata]|uniref:Uncharacterized protein n=6 Tax=Rotaria TaxID=231623 RepID=A0A816EPZ6_9BILA|nr:unnamed protein product [Rotaria magnacalcarata]
MGTQGEDEMNIDYNYGNQKDPDGNFQIEHGNAENKEQDFNDYQYVSRKNRKRRNDLNDQEHTTNSIYSPKRRLTDQSKGSTREKQTTQGTETTLSYFNSNHTLNKQSGESSIRKQIYESTSRKHHTREFFPPFRIIIKDDQYPPQDVVIIKELNKKCKLNLTYGRMSSSKTNKCYLLYCNTSAQFEYFLDKSNWPDKICDCDYTFDSPTRIPSSYSIVMLNVPTQWDVSNFCDELKLQYKTIIKGERLYVRGARPIPKIRIDFSSNKELLKILQSKRMLLDDENTSYPIEPYVAPPRILRCYICQQYDDHIAAHCPNKDKPICFKCGEQHQYNPECQNKICCVHCKGDHLAGNPNCPKKIETRELKKYQAKPLTLPSSYLVNSNKWTGNSAQHLFGNASATSKQVNNNINKNDFPLQLLDTMHSNIQSVLQQQVELNRHIKEQTTQLNCQANEIIKINRTLHEVICPLLKEVTQIIYAQSNSHQKRQIDSPYNKLVDYLNQKDLNQSLVNLAQINTVLQQQQNTTNTTAPSNDITTHTNNESEF